jgi:hypothetical protein
MMDRTTIPRIKPMGRCKITNGTKMLAGVDGRSHIARRLRDIVNGLLIEFPVTGEADLALLKNTATLTIINEQVQAKVALGEVADIPMITNLAGQLRRNLSDLRCRTFSRVGASGNPGAVHIAALDPIYGRADHSSAEGARNRGQDGRSDPEARHGRFRMVYFGLQINWLAAAMKE